jgi:hypothetical protein
MDAAREATLGFAVDFAADVFATAALTLGLLAFLEDADVGVLDILALFSPSKCPNAHDSTSRKGT